RIMVTNSAIYAVAFAPNGNTIAAAGSDGKVRFFDAASGAITKEFLSVPKVEDNVVLAKPAWAGVVPKTSASTTAAESLPQGVKITGLEIQPEKIKFGSRNEYAQLLVTARLESGDTVDATRLVKFTTDAKVAEVSFRGVLRP